ncbi:MAG: PAS domain S-box protein [Clostridiales bacterium]|nr:PAS domain S-box protein [Clostridiales bacterium]
MRSLRRAALLVAGGYAVVATVWIIASDRAALLLFGADRLPQLQTVKGLAYVAVTSAVLYLIVRGLLGRAASALVRERVLSERLDRIHALLRETATLLISVEDDRELLELVCERAVTVGGFTGAWVGALESHGAVGVVAAYRAEAIAHLESTDQDACGEMRCPVWQVLTGSELIVENDVQAHTAGSRWKALSEAGVRSLVAIPVSRNDTEVLALCVFSAESNAFGPAETVALERLGTDLATGLERLAAAQQRAEMTARLEESERRYRDLFISAPRPMWVYDLETLRFLAVNDAAIAQYGYSRDEFLAKAITDIRPPDDIDRFLANVAQVGEGFERAGMWRHVTSDGRVIDVEITSHVIEWEWRRAELVVADDVTAVLESTRALERARARLATIIETSPVPIVVSDADGAITVWNPAAETVFGWSAEEVLGKPNPIVPREEWSEHVGGLGAPDWAAAPAQFQASRMTKGGQSREVVVHTAALDTVPGAPKERVAVIVDITERVKVEAELALHRQHLEELVEERTRELLLANEELQRATQVKSQFLASMSHELRTPLNSIIGFSGVLLQGLAGALEPEQESQIRMINRSGNHLLALINDVLDLSRIESGQVHLEAASFDLCEVVRFVVETLRSDAEGKGLELHADCPDVGVAGFADKLKTQQILFNLVGNGVKFTDEGSVKVKVVAGSETVDVHVTDTGPGILPHEHELVFEEFQQSSGVSQTTPSGTGLGLTISRRLARLMGGDVSLTSNHGSGSVFTFTLPRNRV